MPQKAQTFKPRRSPTKDTRPSASDRGYGANWRRLRLMVLNREPLCRKCQRPATVVDHIRPLNDGGPNDLDNLQPLCKRCHDHKTATQDGGLARCVK
jgi:5-methylcytosine-specific restriction protein A